ncbi:MAG TPA: hypothetical protein VLH60_05805 [Sedimentisphaerales bacterium]|nr:hypothetical protein [Sedimentisphaerales bacterium]
MKKVISLAVVALLLAAAAYAVAHCSTPYAQEAQSNPSCTGEKPKCEHKPKGEQKPQGEQKPECDPNSKPATPAEPNKPACHKG